MAHLTALFPSDLSYNCRKRLLYRTTVIAAASGVTERNQHWEYPLHVFSIPLANRLQTELDTLVTYWHAAAGRANTFNFLDPFEDRSCDMDSEPARTDQILSTSATASQTDFQLIKEYTTGGVTRTRKITRPIANSTLVDVDGSPQTEGVDYDVDPLGIISFGTPMTGGEVVKAGYKFYVPVAFEDDELDILIHNFSGEYVGDISTELMEIRE